MVRILSRLNEFCTEYGIEYILTGTAALEVMGLPSSFKPGDIDIKLIAPPRKDHFGLLAQQQKLSGLDSKDYIDEGTRCFSFYICGVKINALISDNYTRDEALASSQAVELFDRERPRRFIVRVQKVNYALADKMALNRIKDKEYLLDVLVGLTAFIH